MSAPAVSVITPTFRRERQLRESVKSALEQDGVTVEVIVLDDSPEGSAEQVIRELDEPRVRYVQRETPSGGRPALVRNEGLALARGRFVQFLDDDDRLVPGALSRLVATLDAHPEAGFAFGVVEPFGDHPQVLAQQRAYFARARALSRRVRSRLAFAARQLFGPTLLVCSAGMIRREQAVALGGFNAAMPVCEDADFYLRAARRFGFAFTDSPVLSYRTGASSLMHDLRGDEALHASYREMHRAYRSHFGVPEFVALKLWARLAWRA